MEPIRKCLPSYGILAVVPDKENGTWMLILILLVAQLPKELIFSVFNMPTNQVRKYFVLLFL